MAKPFLSPLNQRRWSNFKRNRRAWWSMWIFLVLFVIALFAEFVANDKPILVSYRGELRSPVMSFYSEKDFGGDFATEAGYRDIEVRCLIETGGLVDCFDDPEGFIEAAKAGTIDDPEFSKGWMLWPPIPYSFDTIVDVPGVAPAPPSDTNSSIIGIIAGAIQGYRGGWTDLLFQRFIEIWTGMPSLYVIIILTAILGRSFWLLVFVTVLFGWPALTGLVRAEFLRARNLEYVRAAKALGVSDWTIMFRHILPNAMVATVTMLPFLVTGAIGELTLQAKQNLQAPWLGFTAFFVFAIMLSLLVFIFEGVRDAFDPRKTFSGGTVVDDAAPELSDADVSSRVEVRR